LILALLAALVVAAAVLTGESPAGANSVLAARTTASISVPDGNFAGSTTATVSANGGGTLAVTGSPVWVRVHCTVDADGSTGMVAWEKTDGGGNASFALGPTPSWQSGSASCRADAGTFDSRGRFKISASTTFKVSS
jgi:hypothetical protein